MKFNRILTIAAIFGAALFTACEKEDVAPSSMNLDQASVSIYVGQTATVTPNYSPKDASASPEWTSSDETVATVKGGYVTGVKAGTATITAKVGSFTSSCSVTVSNVAPTKFEITPTEMTLVKNSNSEQITYVLEPYNVTLNTVSFSSSDTLVVKVDETGLVSPVNVGTAVITVDLAAGIKKTCNVTVKMGAETLDFWKSYAAGTRELYGLASDEGKKSKGGWIHWSNGYVSWDANTTGASRTDSLVLESGSRIVIKQIDAVDFKGDYELKARGFFLNNKKWADNYGVACAIVDPCTQAITIGAPLLGETLTDQDGKTYTNQVGLTGFHGDAVMDATVDINYDAKTVRLGLLLDARTAQATTLSHKDDYGYVCFLPEMATSTGNYTWGSPWNFVQADLDDDATKDFVYLWFNANEEATAFQWNSFTEAQFMTRSKATSANRIIGITCAISKATEVTTANVFGTYNVIFQANTSNTNSTYMSFTKK